MGDVEDIEGESDAELGQHHQQRERPRLLMLKSEEVDDDATDGGCSICNRNIGFDAISFVEERRDSVRDDVCHESVCWYTGRVSAGF